MKKSIKKIDGKIPNSRRAYFTAVYKIVEECDEKIVIQIFDVACTKLILTVGGEEEVNITDQLKQDYIEEFVLKSIEDAVKKTVYIRKFKPCENLSKQHLRIWETIDDKFVAEVKDHNIFYEISEELAVQYKKKKYEFKTTGKTAAELILSRD